MAVVALISVPGLGGCAPVSNGCESTQLTVEPAEVTVAHISDPVLNAKLKSGDRAIVGVPITFWLLEPGTANGGVVAGNATTDSGGVARTYVGPILQPDAEHATSYYAEYQPLDNRVNGHTYCRTKSSSASFRLVR